MRRRALVLLPVAPAALSSPALAQSSAADFIAGEFIKVDAERAEVTLRNEPIAHLHLPAKTTTFHFVNARLILRIKAGDKIRFRADRF